MMIPEGADETKRKADAASGNGPGPDELVPAEGAAPSEDEAPASMPSPEDVTEAEPASLEEQLARAREQSQEYLDLAQRARAELINFKRRMEREQEGTRRLAVEALIVDLLPVMDSFAHAVSAYASESDEDNPLLAGLRRTVAQFERVLAKYGVTPIAEAGVPFDAQLHQPLHKEESSDVNTETVGEIYQPGVRIGQRVVRPATVKVLLPEGDAESEEAPPQESDGDKDASDEG